MRRLFFALWPDSTVRAKLARAAAEIVPDKRRSVAAAKLHLTLVFIGSIDDRTIARLCADSETDTGIAFELCLDTSGVFRRAAITWLAPTVIPAELSRLVERLETRVAALGVPPETRPYRPHVTICRGLHNTPVPLASGFATQWPVNDYALVESIPGARGVRYEVLRCWPLGPSERHEKPA